MTNHEIFVAAIKKSRILEKYNVLDILDLPPVLYAPYIFSHEFAKAFWGEEMISENMIVPQEPDRVYRIITRAWQYHLQQMVIEENPIKYLEQFL